MIDNARWTVKTIREWRRDDPRWPEFVRRGEFHLAELSGGAGDAGWLADMLAVFRRIPWDALDGSLAGSHTRWTLRLARLLDRAGEWGAADDLFRDAAATAASAGLPRLECIAWMETGELDRRRGRLDAARRSQERAGEIARRNGLVRETADVLNNLAIIDLESGLLDTAENRLRSSLEQASAIGEKRLEGHIYNNLGVIACMKGMYREALTEFQRAIPFREAADDAKGLADTFHNMSMACKDMNDRDRAAEYLDKALDIALRSRHRGQEAIMTLTRVELLILSGDDRFAEALADQLTGIQESLGDHPGLAETRKLKGIIHCRRRDFGTAVRYLETARDAFRSLGLLPGEAETLRELGDCRRDQGLPDEAVTAYQESLKLYERLGNTTEQQTLTHRIQALIS